MKENEIEKALPKTLPGSVCQQRVKCGKQCCKCAKGELHIAYYRFWREQGRLHKQYVRKKELDAVRAACEGRRKELRQRQAATQEWRALKAFLKGIEEHEQGSDY